MIIDETFLLFLPSRRIVVLQSLVHFEGYLKLSFSLKYRSMKPVNALELLLKKGIYSSERGSPARMLIGEW